MLEVSAEPDHWVLDRRINLSIIVGLLMQTVIFAFFMGQLATRVSNNERVIQGSSATVERLTRVEVKLANIEDTLTRVERQLDKR